MKRSFISNRQMQALLSDGWQYSGLLIAEKTGLIDIIPVEGGYKLIVTKKGKLWLEQNTTSRKKMK